LLRSRSGADPITSEGLIRAIRRWDLVALAINSIVGAGIFGLPAEVFSRIGAYSLGAFVVCAAATTLIVICFAEVSSRFTATGGPYLYARETFGPALGFQVGWMLWIARVTAFAANCNLLVAYLAFFIPSVAGGWPRAVAIAAIVISLVAVNVAGVEGAARLGNVFTVAKLLPLLVFVVVGAFFIDPAAYAFGPLPGLGDFSVAVLLLVYAFSAFEMVVVTGGESRDPRRDLPYALLAAIALVALFYVAIQTVAIGTLPGLATATRPLADAAARFMGPAGAALISAGALVSIYGNLNVTLLVTPRLLFAMAQRGELPAAFARVEPRVHTPHLAILTTGVIVLTLTISGTFVYAATVSVIARLLCYASTCAALPALRRRADAPAAVFRAPGGVAVAGLALALIAWLLSNATIIHVRDTAVAAAIGLALYRRKRRVPND
jgi:amino acid transporter